MSKLFYIIISSLLLSCCGVIKSGSRDELTGNWKLNNHKVTLVDLGTEIEIHKIDTSFVTQTRITSTSQPNNYNLSNQSLDIDLIYLPLKIRPQTSAVPTQLNTNINGQIFIGWRIDKLKLQYHRLVKDDWFLQRKKFGFSSGIILGGGSTFISPTTTLQNYNGEYDGLVFTCGLSTIFAYNNLTFGGTIAFDYLTNEHSNIWIYHGKPYVGLVIGLNIN